MEISLDNDLVEEAMAITGLPTGEAAVLEIICQFVRTHRRRQALQELSGLGWEGDLADMRANRLHD